MKEGGLRGRNGGIKEKALGKERGDAERQVGWTENEEGCSWERKRTLDDEQEPFVKLGSEFYRLLHPASARLLQGTGLQEPWAVLPSRCRPVGSRTTGLFIHGSWGSPVLILM